MIPESRRGHDLPNHTRHADKVRDALTLDQFERALRVPPMHEDQLGAAQDARCHDRVTPRDVEKRHRYQRDRRRLLAPQHHRRHAAAELLRGTAIGHRHDIRADVAMGSDGALGHTRGAGGIEDRRVVLRVDRRIRHRRIVGNGGQTSSHRSITPAVASPSLLATIMAPRSRSARRGPSRSARLASTTARLEPESARQKASSSVDSQALSGTAMAPTPVTAQKATDHSGRLRMAIATRSPLRTP